MTDLITKMQSEVVCNLTESFVIELPSNRYFIDSISVGSVVTTNINHAIHFPTINTALQFNRIVNGRIVSVFN